MKKRGDLPPGLSETIQLVFVPRERKYYYAEVRISGGDGAEFTLPVHAYSAVDGDVQANKGVAVRGRNFDNPPHPVEGDFAPHRIALATIGHRDCSVCELAHPAVSRLRKCTCGEHAHAKSFALPSCSSDVEMEWELIMVQEHQFYDIHPKKGVLSTVGDFPQSAEGF